MKVIGITGRKRHGKGEVGAAITRLVPGSKALGYADKLKLCAARALGFDRPEAELIALMDSFKVDAAINMVYVDPSTGQVTTHELSGREYLQFLGTEGGRQTFGDTFWIDQVLPRPNFAHPEAVDLMLKAMHGSIPVLAITDIRFDNEAQRVRDVGGEIWEVVRPSFGESADTHVSEAGVSRDLIDRTIVNDSDLDTLAWHVDQALEMSGVSMWP
jgi:Deoxynucleotide monophosphate kinase